MRRCKGQAASFGIAMRSTCSAETRMRETRNTAPFLRRLLNGQSKHQIINSPYFENPTKILPVRVDPHAETRNNQMLEVIKGICPLLLGSAQKTPRFEPISGGLSNELFVCKLEKASVLLRIHPSCSSNVLVDREQENMILAMLSRQGDAPLFLGRFMNGRLEQFYDNHIPLSCHDLKDYAREIGRIMARLHSKKVPATVLDPGAPTARGGEVFQRVHDWVFAAEENISQNCGADDVKSLLSTLKNEFHWLETRLNTDTETLLPGGPLAIKAREFANDIVLSHLDCQSLNLLRPQHVNTPLHLIDFEYAGLSPRAFDIANHFCEHCDMNNIKANYETEYPSVTTQDEFLGAYMDELPTSPLKGLNEGEVRDFTDHLRDEIARYTLLSHLRWAIWSVLQSQLSDIDFDYIGYAEHRLEGYNHARKVMWKD